ncbi:MAG: glycoside hydrolase family 15 protein, partial [Anaerolineae bacterium]|nr:glycoside hydrolase family 15 protein [Anaerolineae bacterium]NIN99552.1 glycoside hydrolase family 15 protein [Anaerolineae bacterium]NIQ82412.1 glycoside hydrolase family 15 protein [Anaerolineae bacterium]
MAQEYKRIEDYGLVGNLATCVLIARDGSIDWCCFPHMESPSVFAAILDVEKGGHFYIKPRDSSLGHQRYVDKTNVLETRFETPSGVVTITDFMPLRGTADPRHQLILRKAACVRGSVELEIEFNPRFDYARVVPAVEPSPQGVVAAWQDHVLFLQSPCNLEIGSGEVPATLTINEGESQWLALRYGDRDPLGPEECQSLLDA